ncbi:hypothetical protein TSTA_041430 [Talaromyces stipitatus ATCC 10500]|uniref:Integrase catalytic domain-containing protein n=1 Tax=Talaromyces stipitatus (strain ATCC 10500 / CBS 375.48 / QM 6759 / NRRL 1006) TaxID=441959 RepID=B8MJ76_TALSN|nr:uncharacterized protein TSTA_041430 [Talaromyces stipitatus ATCC 10500]EED14665.1 hypothetical protein TSTA_041430 [Talaromyces stipitatus ATCC 10500]
MIKLLKEKLAPKENREKALLIKRERELTIPKRGTKPKELAKKWRELLMDMNLANFKALTSEQLARDFIDSTEGVLPKFHELWSTTLLQYDLNSKMSTLSEPPTIEGILNEFDSWTDAYAKKELNPKPDITMATFSNKSDQPEKNNERSATPKSNRKITCLDGEEHGFENCPYVNPEKRTSEWKPDPNIQKKFDVLEKDKTHPKAKKLRWVKKRIERKMKDDTSTDSNKNSDQQEQSNLVYDSDEFCGTVLDTVLSASGNKRDMKDEWILDSGSERKDEDLCNIKWHGRLILLEWKNNKTPKSSLQYELAMSSFEKVTLKDPALAWHKRFGHISQKAVQKLEEATEGAVVTTSEILNRNPDGFQEKCEVCEMSKARRKISRVSMTKPTKPFQVLFVDIIVMNLAMNGHTYALHAVDPYTKFHVITTTKTKSVNFTLETMIEEIEHTFKAHIDEVHLDGESSLNGISFTKYCRENKKRLLVTVPGTPERNNYRFKLIRFAANYKL